MSTDWTIERITGPVALPVSLDRVKQKLRLTVQNTAHDAELIDLIMAATEQLEHDTDRVWIGATYRLSLNAFPRKREGIPLYTQPVQSITQITYSKVDGDTITEEPVDPTVYALDTARREVYLQAEQDWPADSVDNTPNVCKIEFLAGYGNTPETVPVLAKQAIASQVAKWFWDPADERGRSHGESAYEWIVAKLAPTHYPG